MFTNIIIFLTLLIALARAASSDGKQFVFTFAYDYTMPDMSAVSQINLIVIPTYNDSICSFKYNYQTNEGRETLTFAKTAKFGVLNEIPLNISNFVKRFDYFYDAVFENYYYDFRAFVDCTEEVKMIGRIADPLNGWSEMFLIPSSSNAATHYTFATPTSDTDKKGIIAVLPVINEGPITLNVSAYANNVLISNISINYDATIGQNQYYISIEKFIGGNNGIENDDLNTSISITSSTPVMLLFFNGYATISNDPDFCDISCKPNYVAFMPIGLPPIACNTLLKVPDQRMITNDYTTRIYVSPPSQTADCESPTKITVFKDTQSKSELVDKTGFTTISLLDSSEAGFSSNAGQLSAYRFGSITEAPDQTLAFGHFAHYVPSTAEWVSGKTQFYSLRENCFLEFYGNLDGSNPYLIKIDGVTLDKMHFTQKHLTIHNNKYNQFIVPILKYGLHSIENSGQYVAYVVCKNVDSPYDSAGYVTAFNKRKTF